jgi:hypothetical protein
MLHYSCPGRAAFYGQPRRMLLGPKEEDRNLIRAVDALTGTYAAFKLTRNAHVADLAFACEELMD